MPDHSKADRPVAPAHDTGVIHGRFQVLHNDHIRYLLAGMGQCRHLVVGITNPDPELTASDPADPDRSRPAANPLTYYERYCLVRAALVGAGVGLEAFSVVPLPINFPDRYRYYVPLDAAFLLTIYDDWGRKKRDYFESLGLTVHVLWEVPSSEKGISGEDIRDRMIRGDDWESMVPPEVAALLKTWRVSDRLRELAGEAP